MNTYLEMAGIHGTMSKIRRLLDTDSAAWLPLRIHVTTEFERWLLFPGL